MRLNRDLYLLDCFTFEEFPDWICPTCDKGPLMCSEENFQIEESVESKNYRQDESWDPDWINGSFTGKLFCSNKNCKECVFVLGRMKVKESKRYNEVQGLWEYNLVPYLYPQMFKPELNLFEINENVPDQIQVEIRSAFKLYWLDVASCINKIRNVVELIMTQQEIVRYQLSKTSKKIRLSLHSRIELFRTKNNEIAEHLMAVKWIGNAGSHISKDATRNDVLDGMEIIRYVTHKLYEKDSVRIQKLVKKINKGKGPIKKRI